ncbi:AmmeMemoRadiSam system protein A [Corallincola luteus]|uniref:AmmeMemoRadiSam system protein A n=1 Tax=Corallincola luteus TaxID=1775177 RepID=A0ABY2ARE0_9GAMM|nr:AmmeMemoRadiSam system protein A [Corallincola luteus]TCI04656.1 AmmeMemoRadiSam system protein A [Corallincola luteus]
MPALPFTLRENQQRQLLWLAAKAIESAVDSAQRWRPLELPSAAWLQEYACCFVTLHKAEQLRGCIGGLSAIQPLWQDLIEHAYDAAFRDPRFAPVGRDELSELTLEVSVLSPLVACLAEDYQALCHQLRPNIDGVLLQQGARRAVFLPQVWHQLPSTDQFLRALLQKGGWPADGWPEQMKVSTFEVASCQSALMQALTASDIDVPG